MNFLDLLIDYILVIIYDSFISISIVLLIFYIFKIRDSNIKVLFLFIPLIKPFIVISENFCLNKEVLSKKISIFGLRFITPNTYFNRFDSLDRSPINYSNTNNLVILIIVISIIIILTIRWVSLYFFYRRLAFDDIVTPKEIPNLFKMLNKYSLEMKIKAPSVCLTHKKLYSPFVIGIKNHSIVLSPCLLERLNENETEILILHELAHIKRKDNLIGWIALILRDLLFFNPFAYIAYYLIKIEQEKASDSIVSLFLKYKKDYIAINTINLVLKITKIAMINSRSTQHPITSLFTPFKKINFKIFKFRIRSILLLDHKKISMPLSLKALMFFLFFILLFIQIIFFVNINNTIILLR